MNNSKHIFKTTDDIIGFLDKTYVNQCAEIMTVDYSIPRHNDFNVTIADFKETAEMVNDIVKKQEERRKQIVEHLLNNGWLTNHKYIEDQKKKSGELSKEEIDVDFEALIMGKYKGDYHLISKCDSYTVRIKNGTANFWRIKKGWASLCEIPLRDLEMTETGIRWEIITIDIK